MTLAVALPLFPYGYIYTTHTEHPYERRRIYATFPNDE